MLVQFISSRLEDYLYNLEKISNIHRAKIKSKRYYIVSTLSNAYNQTPENIS